MTRIKYLLYFPIASYFAFFAKIILLKWKPRIIVVTGSSGKTTLLHMIASQLGNRAKYSYHANSAFGIPFDILGIKRETLTYLEWPKIFLAAPFKIFNKTPKENIYVVEADCDRPNEGKFLSELLNPEVTLWISLARTHSQNFENLVASGKFVNLESAIAYEFGFFIEKTKKVSIVNSDNKYILDQINRTKSDIEQVKLEDFNYKYEINTNGSKFTINDNVFSFKYLLPKETVYSLIMCQKLIKYLKFEFDSQFKKFNLPPGRSSFFNGIKDIKIIDSTYNANLDSMYAILFMLNKIKTNRPKWLVLGDMLEQGKNEEREHKLLAYEIDKYNFDKIILMGPRLLKYTKPHLKRESTSFTSPDEVLKYLLKEIKGIELILFKGSRFLEGVIENLLFDKSESKYLVRREKVWQTRRKKFGL